MSLLLLFLGNGCIENDIPYPIVEGNILSIEVEGQCDADGNSSTQATINKTSRTVSLYIDDTANLSKLRIKKLTVSNNATLLPDSTVCNNYQKFPDHGFESLDELITSADTRVDFSEPVTFTLQTYQDYLWTIDVKQILNRSIILENQIGQAIIDDASRNVVIYVAQGQPLNKIKVSSFNLGGSNGTVVPDPTAGETFDFSKPVTFFVSMAYEEVSYKWTVYVYHAEGTTATTASSFPMTTRASLWGDIQSGKTPVVEYKKGSESSWSTLASSAVSVKGTAYTATIEGLTPDTRYDYRISVDGVPGTAQQFTTAPATPLTDGDFDNWHQNGKLWNPWSSDGESFWDTGNRGATTISDSNSVPTDETCNGSGKAALLESKYLVLKFAAGNIFTGKYLKTTGTNGVLSFGQPFSAFPSKLRVNYKCDVKDINRCGDEEYEYLKGRPDSCHIYIALTDWDEPREIRTRPSERQLFDYSDPAIIAFGQLIKGESVPNWTQHDIVLEYRRKNSTPKYIVVVASASKYGDFFAGGEGTKLWIDNFELIYE
ncbi:MAG: PCMD domain-containing protein [Bacteroides sp.]|nr:PCMD domain-containing protein [Bacteroides sp.]